jgi:thymidylate kinase
MTELARDFDPAALPPTGDTPGPPLEFVVELCAALADAGVRYCHFKSNEAIARSAAGDNDLDLLVDPSDVETFERMVLRVGCRRAVTPAPRRFPAIHDFYGFDRPSGRLVHVHAHYALVVGHDATKNVRLPFEDAYLASATLSDASPFPLPSADFEYVLLVLRLVLKHTSVDAVLSGQGALPATARRELDFLGERADPVEVRTIIERHLPAIPVDAFERAARALRERSPFERVSAARDARTALEAYARRPPRRDTAARVAGRVTWNVRRIAFPRTTSKRLDGMGSIVAVLGSDGSGKTTLLDGLEDWLSACFRTERIHLGKPPKGLGSIAIRALQKVAWRDGDRRLLWRLRHLLIARDRFRAYRRAASAAASGAIALSDRFPTSAVDRMDAPVLGGGRAGALARLEHVYYARIAPPDILLVLTVSPETATARRPSDDPVEIAARANAIRAASWDTLAAVVLDGERPAPEVLTAAKEAIWERLP